MMPRLHPFGALILIAGLSCSSPAEPPAGGPDPTDPPGRWTAGPDLPVPTHKFGAAVYRGDLYLVGGAEDPGFPGAEVDGLPTDRVVRFRAASGTWEVLSPFPEVRQSPSLAVIGDTLYAAGGFVGNGFAQRIARETLHRYDPATDTWEARADMPGPRYHAATTVAGGELYLIGGQTGSLLSAFDAVVYSPGLDAWRTIPGPPLDRAGAKAVTIAGRIYLVGGHSATSTANLFPTIEVLDPGTGQWLPAGAMPTPRSGTGVAVLDGQIHVIGGVNLNNRYSTVHEAYDPVSSTWTTFEPLPAGTERANLGVAVVGGALYAVGGFGTGLVHSGTVQRFVPDAPLLIQTGSR